MHGQPEGCRELPMEVKPGKSSNLTERRQIQLVTKMSVDIFQGSLHACVVIFLCSGHRISFVAHSLCATAPSLARPILLSG